MLLLAERQAIHAQGARVVFLSIDDADQEPISMTMKPYALPTRLKPLADHRPKERPRPPGVRFAAVAAVFRMGDGDDLDLLFIKRAKQPQDPWSGQMAFPGGRMDPQDDSPLATAIRETREEVGLDLARRAHLVGRLDDVQGMARGRPIPLIIRPFVFMLVEPAEVQPNPDEVEAPVWIPLSWLLAGQGRCTMDYDWHGATVQLPCVRFQGYTVWGMTFRMLSNLLELLTPSRDVREAGVEHAS